MSTTLLLVTTITTTTFRASSLFFTSDKRELEIAGIWDRSRVVESFLFVFSRKIAA